MSTNGQGPPRQSLAQRVDPTRMRELEQRAQLHSTLLVARALSDVSNFANALHFLTEQATMGNSTARQQLALLFANLDDARAAAHGIALPNAPAPPGR